MTGLTTTRINWLLSINYTIYRNTLHFRYGLQSSCPSFEVIQIENTKTFVNYSMFYVYRESDELKVKLSGKFDWLNSNEVWADQHKLQNLYHQALVLDLEYALDKKVEQDLWNIGFKNHISSLQEIVRNKK